MERDKEKEKEKDKDKEMDKEKEKQLYKITQALEKSIFAKIPQLNGQREVYLPKVYFENLTDEEFIVLWRLPKLRIRCSAETGNYIEERRKLLGLKRSYGSEVIDGDST